MAEEKKITHATYMLRFTWCLLMQCVASNWSCNLNVLYKHCQQNAAFLQVTLKFSFNNFLLFNLLQQLLITLSEENKQTKEIKKTTPWNSLRASLVFYAPGSI